MAAKLSKIQEYPRDEKNRAKTTLFPRPPMPFPDSTLINAIDKAFELCLKDKKGNLKKDYESPHQLVERCVDHLKKRSDPILSSYFVGQLKAEQIFELDAVSHEMQRHRMSIGIFYQQLLLELLKNRWPSSSIGGYDESDLIAEIETPGFEKGLRLYMAVKKSGDTVGGQDVSGAIAKLENLAKNDKNLNRPYLCVFGIATPSSGRVLNFEEDRKVKGNKHGQPYSNNCEYWGPGFLFPFVSGRSPIDVYGLAYGRVADYLPFRTLQNRAECALLLKKQLSELGLVNDDETINAKAFLRFITGEKMVNPLKDPKRVCLILAADSRSKLNDFPQCADLIVTSPPYADARRNHYDSIHPDKYDEWFAQFHDAFWKSLKDDGSLVINIKDKVMNGVRHRYVWRTIDRLVGLGWNCIEDYIWQKPNPMPGYWPTRLRDGWEYCFHLAKSKRPYMNQDAVRIPIGKWAKTRLENLGEGDKKRHNSENDSGFGRDLSRWVGKDTVLPSNVLTLSPVTKNKGHPAAYPVDLPVFFIKMLSRPGGLIIDPFAGSGTTAIAALSLQRDCVLIDNNPEYCQVAYDRVLKEAKASQYDVCFDSRVANFSEKKSKDQPEQLVLAINQTHAIYEVTPRLPQSSNQ